MKKLFAILLSLLMALSLVGCSSADEALFGSMTPALTEAILAAASEAGVDFPEGDWSIESFSFDGLSMSKEKAEDPGEFYEGESAVADLDAEGEMQEELFVLQISDLSCAYYSAGYIHYIDAAEASVSFASSEETVDLGGVWNLSKVESEGEVMDSDTLAQYGLEGYLILEEDGTGLIEVFGESMPLEAWSQEGNSLFLTADGDTEELLYSDGRIVWNFDDDSYAYFTPAEAAFDGFSGNWVCICVEEDGEIYDAEAMEELGESFRMEIFADGSAVIYNGYGESMECSWFLTDEGILLEAEGESMPGVLQADGSLKLNPEEDFYVSFVREDAASVDYSGSWICTELEMDGQIMDAETMASKGQGFSLELFEDGSAALYNADGDSLEFQWYANEEGVVLSEDGDEVYAPVQEDGSIRLLLEEGMSATFVRGREAAYDPVGDWALAAMNMLGMTITAGDFAEFGVDMSLSIYVDGTGVLTSGEDSGELTWTYEPETATLTLYAEDETLNLQYTEEDLLLLTEIGDTEEDELSMIFARVDSEYYLDAAANKSLAELLEGLQ